MDSTAVESRRREDYIAAQRARADAVFNVCLDQFSEDCGSAAYVRPPQITVSRRPGCPFAAHVCQNASEPIDIVHANITLFEVGVNSGVRLAVNHRLTCVPVYLDSFLVFDANSLSNQSFISVNKSHSYEYQGPVAQETTMELQTMNGPNSFTDKASGRRISDEMAIRDITILPRARPSFAESRSNALHSDMQRDNGTSFLILLRAGFIKSRTAIYDPFFATTQKHIPHPESASLDDLTYYSPDYEATALGCVEQFQYCVSATGTCTPWGEFPGQVLREAESSLGIGEQQASRAEFQIFSILIPPSISVVKYLRDRVYNIVPLSRSVPWTWPNPTQGP